MKTTTISWTALTAAWGVLVAGSFGVMKTVDAARGWTEAHLPKIKFPGYTWILVAFGAGIATCVTSHLNPITTLYPPLAQLYGEVLSGIVLGGIASPLHHGTALIAAKSKGGGLVGVPVDPAIAPGDEQAQIPPDADQVVTVPGSGEPAGA